jgi:hypothetical protein
MLASLACELAANKHNNNVVNLAGRFFRACIILVGDVNFDCFQVAVFLRPINGFKIYNMVRNLKLMQSPDFIFTKIDNKFAFFDQVALPPVLIRKKTN